jgi:hypothetical protein
MLPKPRMELQHGRFEGSNWISCCTSITMQPLACGMLNPSLAGVSSCLSRSPQNCGTFPMAGMTAAHLGEPLLQLLAPPSTSSLHRRLTGLWQLHLCACWTGAAPPALELTSVRTCGGLSPAGMDQNPGFAHTGEERPTCKFPRSTVFDNCVPAAWLV